MIARPYTIDFNYISFGVERQSVPPEHGIKSGPGQSRIQPRQRWPAIRSLTGHERLSAPGRRFAPLRSLAHVRGMLIVRCSDPGLLSTRLYLDAAK